VKKDVNRLTLEGSHIEQPIQFNIMK